MGARSRARGSSAIEQSGRASGERHRAGRVTVLVVEHDPSVADLIRLYLSREGYHPHPVTDPASAAAVARRLRPDAVVLDLTTGVHREVAEAARPAVIVSVVPPGMTPPAGHTVPRPFSPRALLATLGRALRGHQAEPPPPDDVLHAGDVVLDPRTRTVTVAGAPKAVTAVEFELLAFLMRNPGRVFGREQLLAAVWGSAESAGVRTVDVHIAQLRAKLGARSPLRTVRGVGYAADL
ncbi:response regulator transcription factor [Actinoallomurus vinaceus]|uniref:Response regulator transcription factor n=1 Tax=Actinoallomurus vinaceus TaxID=1080074 RepID=A0ABP8U6D9_9ACTN